MNRFRRSTQITALAAWLGLAQSTYALAGGLVAHEWGTFTSVQGSDGRVVEGLQHEEEELPGFVYSRNRLSPESAPRAFAPMELAATGPHDSPRPNPAPAPRPAPRPSPNPCRFRKGMECFAGTAALAGVTQKLETPVIYFYSKKPQRVSVSVDFPQGVISQWYPNAESFTPDLGQASALSNGSMSWTVDVTNAKLELPYVSPNDIWAPSRNVHSSNVKVGGENERFIFYRGLGRFDVPFESRSGADGTLALSNRSEQAIPAAFILRNDGTRGLVRPVGAIAAHGTVNLSAVPTLESGSVPMAEYVAQASRELHRALVASGLYADEAQAMVDTWSRSYFLTPGLRVLYVVPREWTDRLLPLRMTPQPRELVRTLVGRVELMTSAEEKSLVDRIEAAAARGVDPETSDLGRFAEAKLRRASQLSTQGAARDRALGLIPSLQ